jgi:hypothetical protein
VGLTPPHGISYAPILGGLQRGLPGRSVVIPGMVWPAPAAGDPGLMWRSLDVKNCGLALSEFWSPWVSLCHTASVMTSLPPPPRPNMFRKPLTPPVPGE